MPYLSEVIGEFGRYHWWICLLILSNKFGIVFHHMAILFLAPPVKYTCPGNATCCDDPVYDTSVFTRTIVMEWHLICENSWMKDFTQTLFQFGNLLGSVICGIASDNFGRRPVLLACVIVEIFTGIMASFIPEYWSFSLIRLVLGMAVGGMLVSGFVLMMEYISLKYRDLMSAMYHLPFTIGHVLLAGIGYLIRDCMYFQFAISVSQVFLILYICFLPESPRWLVAKNKTTEAVELLTRVATINKIGTEDIEEKILAIQREHHVLQARKGTVVDLFRSKNLRKNSIIMAVDWFVCSYCFYGVSQYISQLTDDIFINVAASGLVAFVSVLLAVPAMMVLGRKPLVCAANLLCGCCLILIAFTPKGSIASVILGCLGVFFSFLVFVVVYIYCSELFPTVVRNAALGISSMMARLGAMIAPFLTDLNALGSWATPVAFGIPPLVAAGITLLLPETKGIELMVTIEEGENLGKRPNNPAAPSK